MTDRSAGIISRFDFKTVSLRNRLAVAPMTRVSATENGLATIEMARYYERFSKGGFGLVITEGIYTDQAFSQGYRFQPGVTDDEQAQAWRVVTERIHADEGIVFAQVMHAGALSQGNRFTHTTAAPSAVRPKGEQMRFYYGDGFYNIPHAMSDEQIADAIEGFASAAKRAIHSAGFDGIEIHGANGYLLDQFLTDYSNHRTDQWGGDTAQRIKLTVEVIKAVRSAVGAHPIGVRISQGKVNDFSHKWSGGEKDAETIFGSIDDASVDFVHVTEFEAWRPAFVGQQASLVALARRYAPGVSLIANGGLENYAHAQIALADGADIIALGKGALANPDYPEKFKERQPIAQFDASILGPIANIKECELSN